jgi:hypothetical protein
VIAWRSERGTASAAMKIVAKAKKEKKNNQRKMKIKRWRQHGEIIKQQ